jgi:hypothetical protein
MQDARIEECHDVIKLDPTLHRRALLRLASTARLSPSSATSRWPPLPCRQPSRTFKAAMLGLGLAGLLLRGRRARRG